MGAGCLSQAWLCLFTLANHVQDLFFFFLFFFLSLCGFWCSRTSWGAGHKMSPPGITAQRWRQGVQPRRSLEERLRLIQGTCQGPALFSALAHSPSSRPILLAPHQYVFRAPRDSAMYQQVILSTEQTLDKWPILLTLYTLPVFTCSRETQEVREKPVDPSRVLGFLCFSEESDHTHST